MTFESMLHMAPSENLFQQRFDMRPVYSTNAEVAARSITCGAAQKA
jgi:hypothetical protein